MSDIRIKTSFPNHHKTIRLQKLLGAQGPLSLIYLWAFAGEDRPKGMFTAEESEIICISAKWEGSITDFIDALVTVGYLDRGNDGSLCLHNWQEHQPWAYHKEERSQKARESASMRWVKRSHTKGKRTVCETHKKGNAPSPFLSFPLPVPKELWNDFLEMRKKKKAPNTERVLSLILKKIEELKEAGNDPVRVIEQSLIQGWKTVWELKQTNSSKIKPSPSNEILVGNSSQKKIADEEKRRGLRP